MPAKGVLQENSPLGMMRGVNCRIDPEFKYQGGLL